MQTQTIYFGTLDVLDDRSWTLTADRVIVRDDEIALDLIYHYTDEHEFHSFRVVAVEHPNGGYESLPEGLVGENEAVVRIFKAELRGEELYVKGRWYERKRGTSKWEYATGIKGVLEPVEIAGHRARV